MKIEVEDLSPVMKKMNISIPRETVAEELKAAFKEARSTAAIAGFRKGAVPINIIKARFGDSIREDVAKRLVETSYVKALKEKEIVPAEMPKIDLSSQTVEEDKDFSYTVTVEFTPRVEINGYKDMELTRLSAEVTEKDVEDALEKVRQSHLQLKETSAGAEEGDVVTVDFEARSLDGIPIKNYKAVDFPVFLGESTPIPGFDEALKGLKKDDRKDARLKFPDNMSEKALAGKEAVFSITVKSVKKKIIPSLDDDFAKDLQFESVEKLREKARDEVKRAKEGNEKERLKNEILDKLIERHRFEVPEALVKRYQAVLMDSVISNMKMGIIAEDDKGQTPEQLREKYKKHAARKVREDIVLDAIAAKEKIEITSDEYDSAVKKLAESRGVTFEALASRIERENSVEIIKDGLKHEKAFDMIIASAKTAP